MATSKIQLAALAVFSSLYDSKKDVFTIISEFIKTSIASRDIYSVNTTQVANFLKSDYGFKIPEAVIATVLGKIAQRTKGEYIIEDMTNLKGSLISTQYESIQSSNNTIIDNLLAYVEQEEGKKLSDTETSTLSQSFCAFLLEDGANVDYSEYISAFIVKGRSDEQFTHQLNTIKEGVVLYSGLQYNDNVNEIGSWSTPLTIYVEPEILFHFAGYNGELYQILFEDFYKLIQEINIKATQKNGKSLIQIKYFPEIKEEIDHFFKTAEHIVESGEMHDSSKTAMVSIVSGCSSGADVIQKKAEFETLLKTYSIFQEETFNFYDNDENQKYNIEGDNLLSELSKSMSEDEIYPHLKYLYYINVLRRGENIQRFENARYILLTGNGKTIQMAHHPLIKTNGFVPLATHLNFITSKLWFKLNKGFGNGNYPKSFDIVNKAQMVLAAHLNNSVSEEYNKIKQKIDDGTLSAEGATAALAELKSRVRKPEDIITENVDDVIQTISDNDIEKYLRERELERIKVKQQEEHNSKLEQNIRELKEEKLKNEYQLTISLIKEIEVRKLQADKKIKTRLRIYKFVPTILFLLYLIIMAIGTYIYTWEFMEVRSPGLSILRVADEEQTA